MVYFIYRHRVLAHLKGGERSDLELSILQKTVRDSGRTRHARVELYRYEVSL